MRKTGHPMQNVIADTCHQPARYQRPDGCRPRYQSHKYIR